MNSVMRESLHPTAQKLIDRLVRELTNYGVEQTNDRLLAMACNPFMATHGMEELDLLMAFISDNEKYRDHIYSVILTDYRQSCMETLEQHIKSDCSLIIPNNDEQQKGNVQNNEDEEAEEVDEMEELRRKRRARESEKVNSNEDTLDPVQSQVRAFFHQQFDPRSGMPAETHNRVGATPEQWLKHWEIIAEYFDIFNWWECVGKSSFPLIYPVAIRILSLPDSNGNQERTFSAATWMDGKLNSRQNDMTFQMKVLLYKNQSFLEDHKKEVLEENKKAAAARTKALLELSTANMKDSDIDEELEGWIDAFGNDD